jgi:hypothetical protein
MLDFNLKLRKVDLEFIFFPLQEEKNRVYFPCREGQNEKRNF